MCMLANVQLTTDHPGAVWAVVHGAGVGPPLSVGRRFFVPTLWRSDTTALDSVPFIEVWVIVTIFSMLLAVGLTFLLRLLCLFTISFCSEDEVSTVPKTK